MRSSYIKVWFKGVYIARSPTYFPDGLLKFATLGCYILEAATMYVFLVQNSKILTFESIRNVFVF